MPRLIDTHCHLLPGVDDGAPDMAVTMKVAWMAVEDGVRTIVATPHQLGDHARNTAELVHRRVAELRAVLAMEDTPLEIVAGGELRVDAELVEKLDRGDALAIGHGRYVLVDLPGQTYVPLEGLLAELAATGRRLVLAHPERNMMLMARPELLPPLVAAGGVLQITAGSLLGTFGPRVQAFAEHLLTSGLVQLVASDVHGIGRRRPMLGQAFHYLVRVAGRETAERLCCHNPVALIAGDDLRTVRPRLTRGIGPSQASWSKAG